MGLKVTVLGSGTVIPTSERKATSLLVETDGGPILLDCGPGALEGVEKAGVSYRSIRKIFLTHFHADHTLDLGRLFSAVRNDRLVAQNYSLAILGPPGVRRFVEAWNALYPSVTEGIGLKAYEIGAGDNYKSGDFTVKACSVDHMSKPAFAYRVFSGGSNLVYTGDAAYSEKLVLFSSMTGLLVCECSFPDGHAAEGHMTPCTVGTLAALSGAKQVLLVHMYPDFGKEDPADRVRKLFKGRVMTARDGLSIEL